jgi:hypothetical protein
MDSVYHQRVEIEAFVVYVKGRIREVTKELTRKIQKFRNQKTEVGKERRNKAEGRKTY